MSINNKILGASGVGGATLFIIIAANLKAFIEGAAAIPSLIKAFSSGMPFGTGSTVIALLASPLIYHFLDKWMPNSDSNRRSFLVEFMTLGAGVGITVAQQWGVGQGSRMVFPIMLGAMAGLLGPLIAKGLKSFTKETPDEPRPNANTVSSLPKSN
jgi:hypothetical protein